MSSTPVLADAGVMGSHVIYSGRGHVCKLATNLIITVHLPSLAPAAAHVWEKLYGPGLLTEPAENLPCTDVALLKATFCMSEANT